MVVTTFTLLVLRKRKISGFLQLIFALLLTIFYFADIFGKISLMQIITVKLPDLASDCKW